MITSFFGGTFFNGEFFNVTVDTERPAGGWFPDVRHRTREEIRRERIELGILSAEVVEEVMPQIVAAPKSRRKVVLADFVGKQEAAHISAIEIEFAVQAYRRIQRQRQEDEELLLLH